MNNDHSLSENCKFVRNNCTSRNACFKRDNQVKVSSTQQSLELEIEKQSSVPKHKSMRNTSKEWEDIDANKTSLVKNFYKSGDTNMQNMKKLRKDDSKSKTVKKVIDIKEYKRRKTEGTSAIPKKLKIIDLFASCENETNRNGNAEKKSNHKEKKGQSSEYSEFDRSLVDQVKKYVKGSSSVKVSSTEQSRRMKRKHSIYEEENVRTELEIEKQSSVPKHRSIGNTTKKWGDINANKNSLVKDLSTSGYTNMKKTEKIKKVRKDDSKGKTLKTVVDSRVCKKRMVEGASAIPKKLKIIDIFASCENETNGNGNAEKKSNPKEKKSYYSEVDSDVVDRVNVISEESNSPIQKSDESEEEIERLRVELEKRENELIDINQKLLQKQQCRTNKKPGDDVTEEKLKINKGGVGSLIPNCQNLTEALDKKMASHKRNAIEISSDEETEYLEQDINDVEEEEKGHFLISDEEIEYVEQNISDVEEEEKGNFLKSEKQSYTDQLENGIYNFVFIEIDTILASNSPCKEITQIGVFKEKTIGNSEAQFFKAIEPKKLDHYLENYKLGGNLLQTLHMQKNDSGKFEFRDQFEILEDGRTATRCVSEREAFEELSIYLASVENCILFSLNEENIKLLINKIKLFSITNKRIHMDSVEGFCTWSSYLREAGGSKEDPNQAFEDLYDGYVDCGFIKSSSSSGSVKKHADVVAKMVHDCVLCIVERSSRDVFQQLVKASRPINSLSNQMPEEECPDLEVQFLELFSSLRPDFPVTIYLKKLETYNISSEDEDGEPRIRSDLFSKNDDEDSELVRLARSGTLAQVEIELAKLPVNDEAKRAAKLNYARRWSSDFDKSFDKFGDTAIIAAARKGKVRIVAALLTAGADPTLAARNSENVTEDAVTAARNGIKNADMAVKKAKKNKICSDNLKPLRMQLILAKLTLTLLLIAMNYWKRASYASVQYSEERWRAFAKNPNKPTDQVTLNQEIKDFIKMNEKTLNKYAIEDSELQQKRLEDYKKPNEKRKVPCPICSKTFTTNKGRNDHIIVKHNPNNFDQQPVLPLELQCQKCYLWLPSTRQKHNCSLANANTPLFLKCGRCGKSYQSYEEKTAHMLKCDPSTTIEGISPESAGFGNFGGGFGGFRHPPPELFIGNFEGYRHRQAGIVRARFDQFRHPPPH